MEVVVKEEIVETTQPPVQHLPSDVSKPIPIIDLSSSDSDSDDLDDSDDDSPLDMHGKRTRVSDGRDGVQSKKRKLENLGVILPVGFLDPLPPEEPLPLPEPNQQSQSRMVVPSFKQFWKAGDYEGTSGPDQDPVSSSGSMDHVRVHPKFLHSNATSHKWALGAFAELLDNSLDEVCHGATYVNIDMLKNKKDGGRMLLVEDNGGGMDPDKMRQCMSLGYSVKSKLANTIGQYGNGFKTSTMRLGADVIVFSRCRGGDGKSPTQSIGLLSYTFLRSTGKEDIVVPILDYEKGGWSWSKMLRSSPGDWSINLETIVHWSPFSSETDLLEQFNLMKNQGTRIIIYNLWEDDQGELELDFDTDRHDIQIRGVNRDEKKIQMAQQFPNSRHFLTYRHSLRSYASILYLRLPPGFRIILRGKDVEYHNIVRDMMLAQEVTYRPHPGADGVPKDPNMFAVVTIGFVKDAKSHIDVQGFNVYHKNRLIKPFWRVWNAAGSDGRGVIGVLEANFVEPAHDKQGFERTTVLSRLEARLVIMQKQYWSTNCHKIGYAPRRPMKPANEFTRETSPEYLPNSSSRHSKKSSSLDTDKSHSRSNQQQVGKAGEARGNGHAYGKEGNRVKATSKFGKESTSPTSPAEDNEMQFVNSDKQLNGSGHKTPMAQKSFRTNGSCTNDVSPYSENNEVEQDSAPVGRIDRVATRLQSKLPDVLSNENGHAPSECDTNGIKQLEQENRDLKERLNKLEEESSSPDLLRDLQFERERCKLLEAKVQEAEQKIEDMNKEQEALIDIFSEERNRRDNEEENLRKKLKDASNTIQELLEKVRVLEKIKSANGK